ncbi:MAG: UDP-N-acetylmuramoyl-L-alanine--D-glutamate ligase, partial [Spirochaetes bacterium]
MAKREMILIMGLGLHGGGIGAANYFVKKGQKVLITDLKSRDELRESIEKLEKSSNV